MFGLIYCLESGPGPVRVLCVVIMQKEQHGWEWIMIN